MSTPAGVWSQLKNRRLFEGNKMGITREDGSQEVTPLQTLEAGLNISLKEYEKLKPQDIFEQVKAQMRELQIQKSKTLFEKVQQACESVGNTFDLKGGPLTPDFLIESFRKLHIEFEDDGSPRLPTLVGGSEAKKAFEPVLKEIQENQELAKKFAAMIEEKRREWRDRENSRKLVG